MSSTYILLGTVGSGRREILADLIANGLSSTAIENGKSTRVYLPGEFDATARAAFAAASGAETLAWGIADGNLMLETPETAPETVFIVADGTQSPVDQMEVFAALLPGLGWTVARVLTVVHCALLEKHPALAEWFKACIHFSDVALLARRENVPNIWMKKFTDAHTDACNPCLLELVKKGHAANAIRVLVPEARRLSMIFDDTDPLDDMEFDEEHLPEEPFDLVSKPDPYFERLLSGIRRIQLPDIREFLSADTI
jgi:hypothetical protein